MKYEINIAILKAIHVRNTERIGTMLVKGLTIGLLLVSLSGCASFIANQITTERASNNVKGNLSDFALEKPICDSNSVCVETVHLVDDTAEHVDLSFNFRINYNKQSQKIK